ncbi:MAG: hypothetical protein V5786_08015 [Psychromonas sp.]
MAKKKSLKISKDRFKKASVTTPTVATESNQSIVCPINPVINFPSIGSQGGSGYNFNFKGYYGKGYDDITNRVFYTIQTLLKNSKNLAEITMYRYLSNGFCYLAEYLALWHYILGREITQEDLTPDLIENFIVHLRGLEVGYGSQKNHYSYTKALLTAMRSKRYWCVDSSVDFKAFFPKNPYPQSNKRHKGATSLTTYEKRQLVVALKQALRPIYNKTEPLTSYELTVCVLAIAMQTGINTSPLLNMTINALSDHPLKDNRKLLTVYKARGNATQLHNLRKSENVELAQGVKLNVAYLIERIIELNAVYRNENENITLLIYRKAKGTQGRGDSVTSMSEQALAFNVTKLIEEYDLKDEDGKPIKVNLSRIRKTFINGIYELSGENILVAAQSAKHKGTDSINHYLQAPEQSKRNLGLLGEIRVKELTGDTQNTPTGRCKDIVNGDRAPKNGKTCADFLGCFRCKSFVITGDDLYRLYSFYWAILRNRESFGRKDWKRHLRNVLSIIDTEIEPEFIKRGMLNHINAEKERARSNPHPYWINLEMLKVAQ